MRFSCPETITIVIRSLLPAIDDFGGGTFPEAVPAPSMPLPKGLVQVKTVRLTASPNAGNTPNPGDFVNRLFADCGPERRENARPDEVLILSGGSLGESTRHARWIW